MKLSPGQGDDGKYHQYCINCRAETVERIYDNGKTFYFCNTCNQRNDRSVVIDPAVKWWVADDEYWHESEGVFIRNNEKKFLFFERLIFPFALTVPSGHVDSGESPLEAAKRETKEEIGYKANKLIFIAEEDIIGDSCRRGADAHRWHAYLLPLDKNISVEVTEKDEGRNPVWLTLEEALQKDLTFPVRRVIIKYRNELTSTNFSS
jgi:8-oxo-dGTP pyrophosphatase MutT (NUDIX family)